MKILSIIVTYNQDILQSKTFQSLTASLAKNDSANSYSLIIYDNSPVHQNLDNITCSFSFNYVHDPHNAGLAKAYNYALDVAVAYGFEWLLLLDQDTMLPEYFTSNLLDVVKENHHDESIVAIVPRVQCLGVTISPSTIKFGGRFIPIDTRARGICQKPVTTINSGSSLRISFMQVVGDFNTLFYLDYLDHWLFSTIYSNNKKVFISDSTIVHELSVLNYDKWMNPGRYENILKAEVLFLDMCRPKYEKCFYLARIINRIIKQLLQRNKHLYLIKTWRALQLFFLDNNYRGKLR